MIHLTLNYLRYKECISLYTSHSIIITNNQVWDKIRIKMMSRGFPNRIPTEAQRKNGTNPYSIKWRDLVSKSRKAIVDYKKKIEQSGMNISKTNLVFLLRWLYLPLFFC